MEIFSLFNIFFNLYNILTLNYKLKMSTEIDSVLSGIIVLLLIIVVWKWYGGQSSMTPSSGTTMGRSQRHGASRVSTQRRGVHPGGRGGVSSGEIPPDVAKVIGSGPHPQPGSLSTQDWQSATADIGVDQSVGDSHQDWCNSLTINGVPTGASSCTTLEETGRSYGSSNFHGLTARKWCKARQLATPASDARVTPSHNTQEWCNISMDDLV